MRYKLKFLVRFPTGCRVLFLSVFLAVLSAGCTDDTLVTAPTAMPASVYTATPAMLVPTPTALSTATATPTPTVSAAGARPGYETVTLSEATPTANPIPTRAAPTPRSVQSRSPATRGGTLNLVSLQTITHQDVHQDVSAVLAAWGPGIAYSRLLRFESGADVALPSLSVECEICNGWAIVDETTFEFRLRNNVLWQDLHPVGGRPLVAADIAYSYDRQRSNGAPNAALLHTIDSVEAPADDLLRVSLIAPDADFLVALADGHSKIVAREAVELDGDLIYGPTIGSGPWIFQETHGGMTYTFERNEEYFERDEPLLDRLNIHAIPDRNTAYAAFRVNNVDVHQLHPLEWDEFSRQKPDASVLAFKEIGSGLEVAFKTTEPPFDELGARQAAMLAMRPNRAIEEIWHGAAYLTQGVPLATAGWRLADEDMKEYFDDHSRATALLAAAAGTLPVPVVIKVGDFGAEYRAHADRIAAEMRNVGFAAELEVVDRRRFGERVWFGGDYRMFVGPMAPIASPNSYLLTVLSSEGAWNTTEHRNEELDSLILNQAGEYDSVERQRLVVEAQRLALDNAYRFMPAATVSLWTWWPDVQGFEPNFTGSEYSHWSRVWMKE